MLITKRENPAGEASSIRALLESHAVSAVSTLVILGSGLAGCYQTGELRMLGLHADEQTQGHPGKLGILGDATLVAIGRRHLYEGARFEQIVEIVQTAAAFGARRLVVTNAAGGLDPRYRRGDIMLIDGVIGSLLGRHLGAGRSIGPGGIGALSREEGDRIVAAALSRGVALQRGIYAGVTGPSYETRAEIRMLRSIGASAVGMSTIPEMIAARAHGMSVIGLSLITNVASDTVAAAVDHEDVLASGREAARKMSVVIDLVVG